jgi:hypothetical protein
VTASRPATGGETLIQAAIAGDASHSSTNGAATQAAAGCSGRPAGGRELRARWPPHMRRRRWPMQTRAQVRLRGGDPLQQIAPAQAQAKQRPSDRIEHEPGLMRQKRQQQRSGSRRARRPCAAPTGDCADRCRRAAARSRRHQQQGRQGTMATMKCSPEQGRAVPAAAIPPRARPACGVPRSCAAGYPASSTG